MAVETDVYRDLQEHLNEMPVGYPATESGVEIELLKAVFTPDQAEVAVYLGYKYMKVDDVYAATQGKAGSPEELTILLDAMVAQGAITRRERDGEREYALLPLVLWGTFEHQLKMLTPGYLQSFGQYMQNEFGAELAASALPRSRYIPVEESVEAELRISTYDEMHELIEAAGDQLCIQECVCRKVKDMIGQPCRATDRREVCMSFGDLADLYVSEGWGRRITQEEAFEIARLSQDEGLVLMPGNAQEPTFMCACCDDCCAMLTSYKYVPRPADIVASNYYVEVEGDQCAGSGFCVDQCPTDALQLRNGSAVVDLGRCIGCGLCVPVCPEDAIRLVKKPVEMVPPATEEALYDTIMTIKQSREPSA